jgi:hypothetical protein
LVGWSENRASDKEAKDVKEENWMAHCCGSATSDWAVVPGGQPAREGRWQLVGTILPLLLGVMGAAGAGGETVWIRSALVERDKETMICQEHEGETGNDH